jgi:hypothetical protein
MLDDGTLLYSACSFLHATDSSTATPEDGSPLPHHYATKPELAGESYLRKWAEAAKNVWARCSPKDTAMAEDEEPEL